MLREADLFYDVGDLLLDHSLADAVDQEYELYVLINGVAVDEVEVLEDVPDVFLAVLFKIRTRIVAGLAALDEHLALFICVETGYDVEKRRLAASRLTGDNNKLANVKIEIDFGDAAGDHPLAVIEFRYISKLYHISFRSI